MSLLPPSFLFLSNVQEAVCARVCALQLACCFIAAYNIRALACITLYRKCCLPPSARDCVCVCVYVCVKIVCALRLPCCFIAAYIMLCPSCCIASAAFFLLSCPFPFLTGLGAGDLPRPANREGPKAHIHWHGYAVRGRPLVLMQHNKVHYSAVNLPLRHHTVLQMKNEEAGWSIKAHYNAVNTKLL